MVRHKAFTLAEVLITLAIIGIVAAITIPSISSSMNKQDTVVKVKKEYSILSQATESIKADCGGHLTNCLTNPSAAHDDAITRKEVANLYKAKLQINKECPTSSTLGCFANIIYKYLDNTDSYNYATLASFNNTRFGLTDGTAVAFYWNGGITTGSATGQATNLFAIYVDINGVQQPNQWGKDLFQFYYDSSLNVLKQYGKGASCSTGSYGASCAYNILQDGEINYY